MKEAGLQLGAMETLGSSLMITFQRDGFQVLDKDIIGSQSSWGLLIFKNIYTRHTRAHMLCLLFRCVVVPWRKQRLDLRRHAAFRRQAAVCPAKSQGPRGLLCLGKWDHVLNRRYYSGYLWRSATSIRNLSTHLKNKRKSYGKRY
jgi:hypothetical protein